MLESIHETKLLPRTLWTSRGIDDEPESLKCIFIDALNAKTAVQNGEEAGLAHSDFLPKRMSKRNALLSSGKWKLYSNHEARMQQLAAIIERERPHVIGLQEMGEEMIWALMKSLENSRQYSVVTHKYFVSTEKSGSAQGLKLRHSNRGDSLGKLRETICKGNAVIIDINRLQNEGVGEVTFVNQMNGLERRAVFVKALDRVTGKMIGVASMHIAGNSCSSSQDKKLNYAFLQDEVIGDEEMGKYVADIPNNPLLKDVDFIVAGGNLNQDSLGETPKYDEFQMESRRKIAAKHGWTWDEKNKMITDPKKEQRVDEWMTFQKNPNLLILTQSGKFEALPQVSDHTCVGGYIFCLEDIPME